MTSPITPSNTLSIVPSLQVSNAVDRVKVLMSIVRQLKDSALVDGMDYGKIPGTGDKPTLLLPGMEKLMRALNAVPEYIERRVIVDYDRPLFHYEYECRLIDVETGMAIPGGRGLGLCTSMESSFRWRKAERICPTCGQPTIIKGKVESGGGWLCWKTKGGCGEKFKDGDKTIEDQEVGRIENPDIFDQVNAIMKRGKKRALGDAIKGAANVSEFFTVDLEDLPHVRFADDEIVEGQVIVEAPKSNPVPSGAKAANGGQPKPPTTPVKAGAWQFTDQTVTDLMFESKDWSQSRLERMNMINDMRIEGAFQACDGFEEAVAALKLRLDNHHPIDLDAPPDDEPKGAKREGPLHPQGEDVPS